MALPLHVFEPRYRALLDDCVASSGSFGIILIRDGREVGDAPRSLAEVGTVAELREVRRHPDGRADIVVVGARRFRVRRTIAGRQPYLLGEVELLGEPLGEEARCRALARRIGSRFVEYIGALRPLEGEPGTELEVELEVDRPEAGPEQAESAEGEAGSAEQRTGASDEPAAGDEAAGDPAAGLAEPADVAAELVVPDDPTALSYLMAGLVQVEPTRRQRLLEAATTEERLVALDALLRREIRLLADRLAVHSADPRLLQLRRN